MSRSLLARVRALDNSSLASKYTGLQVAGRCVGQVMPLAGPVGKSRSQCGAAPCVAGPERNRRLWTSSSADGSCLPHALAAQVEATLVPTLLACGEFEECVTMPRGARTLRLVGDAEDCAARTAQFDRATSHLIKCGVRSPKGNRCQVGDKELL